MSARVSYVGRSHRPATSQHEVFAGNLWEIPPRGVFSGASTAVRQVDIVESHLKHVEGLHTHARLVFADVVRVLGWFGFAFERDGGHRKIRCLHGQVDDAYAEIVLREL